MTKVEVLNIDTQTAQMSINQLKQTIDLLKKSLNACQIGSLKYEEESRKLITAQNQLKNAQDLSKASLENFNNSIFGMQTRLNNARRALYQMSTTDPKFKEKTAEVKHLADQLNKARIAAGDFRNNIGNYPSAFAKFGTSIKGLAGGIIGFSTGVGAAVAAIRLLGKVIKNFIKTNMEFEKSMAKINAIARPTKEQLKELSDEAKRLGATTLYTATQVSELQLALAKLGFSVPEIKQATKAVLDFALATGSSLDEAATLAGATVRSFGLSTLETERAVSALTAATTQSALDFQKLSVAIPIVGGTANALGFQLEDTLAILGQLSNAGMEASMAGTATRNIMLSLANSSSKLSKELGKPIRSAQDLGEALKTLKERNISLGEIFDLSDKRTVTALSTLIEQCDQLGDAAQNIRDLKGELDEMSKKQINTLSGQVTLLTSAWDGLMLAFSNSTGPMAKVVSGLTDIINKLRQFVNGTGETVIEYAKGQGVKNREKNAEKWVEQYKQDVNISQELMAKAISGNDKERKEAQAQINTILENQKKTDEKSLKNIEAAIKSKEEEAKKLGDFIDETQSNIRAAVLLGPSASLAATNAKKELEEAKKQERTLMENLSRLYTAKENYESRLSMPDVINQSINQGLKANQGTYKSDKDKKSAIANQRAYLENLYATIIKGYGEENQNDINYVNKVYAANVEMFTKIRDLYAVNSDEWYKMDTKIQKYEVEHQEKIRKIKASTIDANAKAEIENLYKDWSLSDDALNEKANDITRKSLEEKLTLYSEYTKEYQEIQAQLHDLDVKDIKQKREVYKQQVSDAEKAYNSIINVMTKLQENFYSADRSENTQYNNDIAEITKNYGINIAMIEKQVDLGIISKEDANQQLLDLDNEFFETEELLTLQHEENLRRIREEQIRLGAEDALDVLSSFAASIQDDVFGASLDGIINMAGGMLDTFTKMGPELDRLNKSLDDVGASMTTQEKSLVMIGKVSATAFNGMSSMLMDIADKQDETSREGFETAKKLNIAAATMSMIGGVVNALAGIPSYIEMFKALGIGAPPAGIALGSALAAMVGALGAANIALIASVQFDGSSSSANTNTGALATIAAPVQYSANVEGASTADDIDQNRYVVSVTEINQVQNRVNVQEREATF